MKLPRLGEVMLAASTQDAVDRFAERLCVSAIVPEFVFERSDLALANVCKVLEASMANVAEAVRSKVAMRIFTVSWANKVEHHWPTDDYLVLVKSLLAIATDHSGPLSVKCPLEADAAEEAETMMIDDVLCVSKLFLFVN